MCNHGVTVGVRRLGEFQLSMVQILVKILQFPYYVVTFGTKHGFEKECRYRLGESN